METAWIQGLIGGALIGVSATVMLLFIGRIAGISGIFHAAMKTGTPAREAVWRRLFLLGLLGGGVIAAFTLEAPFQNLTGRGLFSMIVAGMLVGFGTRMGSGCTSGHGVCGISRFSPRSVSATLTFVATGIVTATVVRVLGG